MSNFVIFGVAGYIAIRHIKAIKELGHNLVAAYDKSDSVGVLDSFFHNVEFFTEFEVLDDYLKGLIESGVNIDYVVVCSPNYMHVFHSAYALRLGANVICEKPLVLSSSEITKLQELEYKNKGRLYSILQLRLHKEIEKLKRKYSHSKTLNKKNNVKLTYITSRGPWYNVSWKNDEEKSGGICSNIGVHFFDMLIYLFGAVESVEVHVKEKDTCSGFIKLKNAEVDWFLSTDQGYLPDKDKRTYRAIEINGEEVEFSEGFTDLHKISYEQILSGDGFGLSDNVPVTALIENIRSSVVKGESIKFHDINDNL